MSIYIKGNATGFMTNDPKVSKAEGCARWRRPSETEEQSEPGTGLHAEIGPSSLRISFRFIRSHRLLYSYWSVISAQKRASVTVYT